MASFSSSGGGLPLVGGRAVIEGMNSFNKSADKLVARFADINRAAMGIGKITAYSRLDIGGIAGYIRFPNIMTAVTAAAVGASGVITALGAKFEKTGRAVQVFGDTTEREMMNIQKQSVQLSRSFTTPANDISKAAISLGKAGAPIKELNNQIIKSAVIFEQAAQSEISAAEAGDLIVQTITALGLKYTDSIRIVDTYVGAVNKTTLTYTELQNNMRQLLPIMGALNIDVLDGSTALGLLAEAGLRGTIGGTALKNALIALADPSKEAAKIMKDYNLTLFDAQGKTLPLIEIIGRLSDAFGDSAEGMTEAQKVFATTDIFSTRQILAAFSLIKQGPAAFGELKTAIQGVSSEKVATDLQNNLIDQFKIILNQIQANTYAFTGEFVPSLTRGLTAINSALHTQGVEGFVALGQEIKDIITLQDEFTRTLVSRSVPSIIKLLNSLGNALGLLGSEFKDWRSVVLSVADQVSKGIIGISVAVDILVDRFRSGEINIIGSLRSIRNNVIAAQASLMTFSQEGPLVGIFDPSGYQHKFQTNLATLLEADANFLAGIVNTAAGMSDGASSTTETLAEEFTRRFNAAMSTLPAAAAAFESNVRSAFQAPILSIEDEIAILTAPSPRRPIPMARPIGLGSTFAPAGGGGGSGPQKEDIDKIASRIRQMLYDLPAMNQELADFLAGITQDFPERLGGMVSTLLGARDAVGQLAIAKSEMLAVDLQLIDSAARLSDLEGQAGRLELEQAKAVLGYDRRLLGLRHQLLEMDKQTWSIRDEITRIEREINELSRENYALTRERIQLEIQMLPLRQQLEAIDKRISATQRTDWRARREQLLLEQQAIPFKRQIQAIEEKITASVDRRAQLLKRREEIGAESSVESIRSQLTDTEQALTKAWAAFDVPTILALEEKKKGLSAALEVAENKLKGIQTEQTKIARATELTTINYELEKLAIEASLKPIKDKLQALSETEEITSILNAITNTYLEEEKQALALVMEALEDKLKAISNEVTLENLRNQLSISHLDEERQRLQDMLIPYEDQRKAIERIIAEVDLMRARTALEFEERKIGIQAMILDEKLRQAELIETQRRQNLLFQDLVLGFINTLAESKNFTAEEGLEVVQRLGLWSDQIAKLIETKLEFNRIKAAADAYTSSLHAMPKNIEVIITTVHRDRYEGTSIPATTTGEPEFARGGIVPGMPWERRRIIAHGGEIIINPNTQTRSKETAAAGYSRNITNNNNHTYSVAASYANHQSPASIGMDIRALIMMAQRG